jgi:hypothetical protein
MAVRVAINGFERTGRAAFRAAFESGADIDGSRSTTSPSRRCSPKPRTSRSPSRSTPIATWTGLFATRRPRDTSTGRNPHGS